jgi:hypothetical protein
LLYEKPISYPDTVGDAAREQTFNKLVVAADNTGGRSVHRIGKGHQD